jgi:hypothetical protein
MTALNVVLKRDRAILMTDAACYDGSGEILGIGQKAVAIPAIKAAIACRGALKLTALLAMELSITFDSFDQLLAKGPEFFSRWVETIGDALALGTENDVSRLHGVEMVVVGWSDALNKPMGFFFATTTDEGFQMIDDWAFGPMPTDEEDANLHKIGCEMERDITAANFDPVRHGIPTMEAQRRMKIIPPSSDLDTGISIVGGHILLTEVTEHGVEQRVIHRWKDQLHQPIVPAPFLYDAAVGESGLSRAERRRMAKVGRR